MFNKITRSNLLGDWTLKKEYYLIGGGEYDDKIEKKVEAKILQRIHSPCILIIPWTFNDADILKKYYRILFSFFKRLKAKKIIKDNIS